MSYQLLSILFGKYAIQIILDTRIMQAYFLLTRKPVFAFTMNHKKEMPVV